MDACDERKWQDDEKLPNVRKRQEGEEKIIPI